MLSLLLEIVYSDNVIRFTGISFFISVLSNLPSKPIDLIVLLVSYMSNMYAYTSAHHIHDLFLEIR